MDRRMGLGKEARELSKFGCTGILLPPPSASLAQWQSVCLVNRRSLVRFQHEAGNNFLNLWNKKLLFFQQRAEGNKKEGTKYFLERAMFDGELVLTPAKDGNQLGLFGDR